MERRKKRNKCFLAALILLSACGVILLFYPLIRLLSEAVTALLRSKRSSSSKISELVMALLSARSALQCRPALPRPCRRMRKGTGSGSLSFRSRTDQALCASR